MNPFIVERWRFYWVHEKENKKYLAVVDCTGHGVPGAFMTIIGINILNQILDSDLVLSPSEIIQELNTRLRLLLNAELGAKDGMDIGLICIEKGQLSFAGTNISCYIIEDGETTKLSADKGFIGYKDQINVTTKTTLIEEGQMIYLFTDGYRDQKGGERSKKFYISRFVDLLESISTKELQNQREELKENFENWKGDMEQMDDVLVVGMRV